MGSKRLEKTQMASYRQSRIPPRGRPRCLLPWPSSPGSRQGDVHAACCPAPPADSLRHAHLSLPPSSARLPCQRASGWDHQGYRRHRAARLQRGTRLSTLHCVPAEHTGVRHAPRPSCFCTSSVSRHPAGDPEPRPHRPAGALPQPPRATATAVSRETQPLRDSLASLPPHPGDMPSTTLSTSPATPVASALPHVPSACLPARRLGFVS